MAENRKLLIETLRSTPEILRDTLQMRPGIEKAISALRERGLTKVLLVGCGSSFNIASVAEYVFTELANYPASAVSAFDLVNYRRRELDKNTLVIALSHSGATKIVVDAARLARKGQAHVLAVTHTHGSAITSSADDVRDLQRELGGGVNG